MLPPCICREHLREDLRKFLGQSVAVHADRHHGYPQPDIIAVMGAESTGASIVFLDLVPVSWIVKPVDSRGMCESLQSD